MLSCLFPTDEGNKLVMKLDMVEGTKRKTKLYCIVCGRERMTNCN